MAAGARWVSPRTDARYTGITRVDVAIHRGRIEIGSRSGGDVRLRSTTTLTGAAARWAGLRAPRLPAAEVDGDVLRLSCARGQVRLQLDVPAGLVVRARVAHGDLTLWGVGGTLDLAVDRGILAGRDLVCDRVRASNHDGEVNLHFAAAPADVDASTERGAVVLVLPAAVYRVSAEPAGEVTVEHDEAAAAAVRARSGTGPTSVLVGTGSETI